MGKTVGGIGEGYLKAQFWQWFDNLVKISEGRDLVVVTQAQNSRSRKFCFKHVTWEINRILIVFKAIRPDQLI